MSCGGRVYRGDTITISVPFEVDDYSNLTITYSTLGDNVVTKTQDEVTIEDGFITYTFEDGELDLLPDGVIYYTIACDVDGVPNVDSTNTNIYLKTPAGYSGKTAEDYYQEGYEAGLEDCSGGTPCDCTEEKEQAFQSGYTAGAASCSGDTPCDCESAVTQAYQEGYAAGIESCHDCPSGSSCNLETRQFPLNEGFTPTLVEPSEGYDGISSVYVYDNGYGQQRYDNGYAAGQAACSGTPCDCSEEKEEAFQSGYTAGYTSGSSVRCELYSVLYVTTSADSAHLTIIPDPQFGNGFSVANVNMDGFGQKMYNEGYQSGVTDGSASACSEAIEIAYQSGYSAGLADCPSCDCTSAVTEAYQSGISEGVSQQKALLSSSSFTENGTYTRADGWSSITVETQSNLVGSRYYLDSNFTGRTTVAPTHPYNGFTQYQIIDDGYGESKYQSGYSAGLVDCIAHSCESAVTEAYQSGFTAGEGELHTIEVVIKTDENYYVPFEPSATPKVTVVLHEGEGVPHTQSPYDFSGITEGDGLDDYVGTYYFETQSPDNPNIYYCSQIYDTTAKTLTLCYKGYCINSATTSPYPVFPPPYTCPAAVGLSVEESNIGFWVEWSVQSIRFNGRPIYDNNGGLSKIGNGGFKMVPTLYREGPSSYTGYRDILIITYN